MKYFRFPILLIITFFELFPRNTFAEVHKPLNNGEVTELPSDESIDFIVQGEGSFHYEIHGY
jgi:hypothetical protein